MASRPEPLVGAVAGALDEAELLDVARDGRLRGVEALLMQAAPQLLLAVERLAIDEFQDDGLPTGFHEFTTRIHDPDAGSQNYTSIFVDRIDTACINILFDAYSCAAP